jgi:hypothetical protein
MRLKTVERRPKIFNGRLFVCLFALVSTCHGVIQSKAEIQWDIQSPLDYQVFQRDSLESGEIHIKGQIQGKDLESSTLQYRFGHNAKSDWVKIEEALSNGFIECSIKAPAGGWYQMEFRIVGEGETLGEYTIPHVGVGELFVVAGQSNSANHGEERQRTQTEKVSAFDGTKWQMANDPQPGASGNRGSFIPAFGDAMARHFQVPIGVVACGIGATSVREWLPEGSLFPNPPTLTGRVKQLANGELGK